MKRYLCFILLVSVFSASCTTAKPHHQRQSKLIKEEIMRAYLTSVKKSDGIDIKEAILLAQSNLIFRKLHETYLLDKPTKAFEDEERFGIMFYPVTKTWRESLVQSNIMILVHKITGDIEWYFQG